MDRAEMLSLMRDWANLDEFDESQKSVIESLHKEVLGRGFVRTSCHNCYKDACIIIYNHLKKNLPMANERTYRLKAGALIQEEFGSQTFYVDSTLTDKVAVRLLRANPQLIGLFASYPEDWMEQIKTKTKKTNRKSDEGQGYTAQEQE